MKILYFTPHFPPQSEAAATRGFWFSKTLQDAGHDVKIYTGRSFLFTLANNKASSVNRLFWENVVGIELFFYVFFSSRTMMILSSPPFFTVLWATFACVLRKKKYILDIRDLYPEVFFETGLIKESSLSGKLLKSIASWMYNRAESVMTVTSGLCEIISGYGAKKTDLIMNGYDSDLFYAGSQDEKFDQFTLVFHGNLGKVQNISTLLNLAEKLLVYQDVQILVAGLGPKAKEITRSKFKNVKYIGNLPYDQIPQLLRKCHVGLSFRTEDKIGKEAFPVKVFEYMGCGLPTIMTPKGEAGEIVENLHFGKQFENAQISEMVNTILEYKNWTPPSKTSIARYSRASQTHNILEILERSQSNEV